MMPRAFFDDWVKVAGEEAKHYSLWHARLGELGKTYGYVPARRCCGVCILVCARPVGACIPRMGRYIPAHATLWDSAEKTAGDILERLAIVHMVHEARGLDTYALADVHFLCGLPHSTYAFPRRVRAGKLSPCMRMPCARARRYI